MEKMHKSKNESSPEKVLQRAIQEDLDKVVVIGYCKDGTIFTTSSEMTRETTLWLLTQLAISTLDVG